MILNNIPDSGNQLGRINVYPNFGGMAQNRCWDLIFVNIYGEKHCSRQIDSFYIQQDI